MTYSLRCGSGDDPRCSEPAAEGHYLCVRHLDVFMERGLTSGNPGRCATAGCRRAVVGKTGRCGNHRVVDRAAAEAARKITVEARRVAAIATLTEQILGVLSVAEGPMFGGGIAQALDVPFGPILKAALQQLAANGRARQDERGGWLAADGSAPGPTYPERVAQAARGRRERLATEIAAFVHAQPTQPVRRAAVIEKFGRGNVTDDAARLAHERGELFSTGSGGGQNPLRGYWRSRDDFEAEQAAAQQDLAA